MQSNNNNVASIKINQLYNAIAKGNIKLVGKLLQQPTIQNYLISDAKTHEKRINTLLTNAISARSKQVVSCIFSYPHLMNDKFYFEAISLVLKNHPLLELSSENMKNMIVWYLNYFNRTNANQLQLYTALNTIYSTRKPTITQAIPEAYFQFFLGYVPPQMTPGDATYKSIDRILASRDLVATHKLLHVLSWYVSYVPKNFTEEMAMENGIKKIFYTRLNAAMKIITEGNPSILKFHLSRLGRNELKDLIKYIISVIETPATAISIIVNNLDYKKHQQNIDILQQVPYPTKKTDINFKLKLIEAVNERATQPQQSSQNLDSVEMESEHESQQTIVDANQISEIEESNEFDDFDSYFNLPYLMQFHASPLQNTTNPDNNNTRGNTL